MKSKRIITAAFLVLSISLCILIFTAINAGSLKVSVSELFRGLFVEYNDTVATIYDLRFPRIFVALLAGGAIAVSGVLFQSVMKNPLADPALVGISSGANFTVMLVTLVFPQFTYSIPLFATAGGLITFAIIYSLSWKDGLNPLRVILIGVAIDAMFSGIISACSSSVTSIVKSSITMKTWSDVSTLFVYVSIAFFIAVCCAGKCNLLALDDRTARAIGINVNIVRLYISVIAVMLASVSTAIVGVIGFLGLIVPHIARLIIGPDCKVLIPFSFLLGSFALLFADTIGRIIAAPYEINASIIMAVIGGPCFIWLLRKNSRLESR